MNQYLDLLQKTVVEKQQESVFLTECLREVFEYREEMEGMWSRQNQTQILSDLVSGKRYA